MRLAAGLRPVFARTLRASRGIDEGRGQITATPSQLPGFSVSPLPPSWPISRGLARELVGEDTDAAGVGPGALLTVEQVVGVLTQAPPIRAPVWPGLFRDEEAARDFRISAGQR
jgi:hypothetical protein